MDAPSRGWPATEPIYVRGHLRNPNTTSYVQTSYKSALEPAMRKSIAVILGLALLVPTVVWALGSDHPQQVVQQPNWPEGLAELANAENRVHGFFVNWEDFFFFRGETADLNEFLTRYSMLASTKLEVVLHPGKLEVRSPGDEQPRDVVANWRLYARSRFLSSTLLDKAEIDPAFITRIDVWLGGEVKLADLRVPHSVSVRSGGEIEAFVREHGEKRRSAVTQEAP
ncbi:MAG: hypothetical protein AAGG38_04875 [Planctomycetota bacterium]